MTQETKKPTLHPWEAKIVGGGSLGESGDFDEGYWEISNGKMFLFTNDEDMSAEDDEFDNQWKNLTKALNDCQAKFWTAADDHAFGLELELSEYKKQCEQLEQEVARLVGIIEKNMKMAMRLNMTGISEQEQEKTWQAYKQRNNL